MDIRTHIFKKHSARDKNTSGHKQTSGHKKTSGHKHSKNIGPDAPPNIPNGSKAFPGEIRRGEREKCFHTSWIFVFDKTQEGENVKHKLCECVSAAHFKVMRAKSIMYSASITRRCRMGINIKNMSLGISQYV